MNPSSDRGTGAKSGRDQRVDRYLAQLPVELPAAGLGERVVALHLRRRRLRRACAPLAVAAGLILWLALAQRPMPPADVAAERVDPALIEVRSADRRLQAAYLAGADASELDALWRQRERAAQLESPQGIRL
jgi:hypothetical protein